VEAAQADLEREQANLEDLTAGPRKPEIDDREAVIQQREVALKQAERSLEKASLLAPIDGTVVEMTLEEGERIATSDIAVRMADFSEWKIETTDLTELGVVRIEIGDPVQVTFDALPDLELEGTVTSIQEIGKNQQGDIVYKVTVTPEEWDSRLRWGMTATVAIEPSDTEADDIDASANEDDEDEDDDDE
jgi:HlyD family secretion protein